MRTLQITFCVLSSIVICHCLPRTKRELESPIKSNVAGLISQIIATNLLKDNAEREGNHVLSPLGITSLLAILAEGAKGDTYNEFTLALNFPEDKKVLRDSMKDVIGNLYHESLRKSPLFRTWLYIYKNNSARDDYKQILQDSYFVDIKDINNESSEWEDSTDSIETTTAVSNSKDILEFETLKKSQLTSDTSEFTDSVSNDEIPYKDASKFDQVVDDKQYEMTEEEEQGEMIVQKPQPEILVLIEEKKDIVEPIVNVEDNETVKDEEKMDEKRKPMESTKLSQAEEEANEPEKITIPFDKLLDDFASTPPEESHSVTKRFIEARNLVQRGDVAGALSANSMRSSDNSTVTKMLLFNGLYYRGNWAYPFQELRSGDNELFYVNKENSIPVTMMRTRGNFRIAELKKSLAVELPYEDKRYAFIAIVPKEKDGLKDVIAAMQPGDYENIESNLSENFISLCIPKFIFQQTTHSEETLKRLGLQTIFTNDADLSGISKDTKLYVEAVVQNVNIKFDEGAASDAALSAVAESRSSPEDLDNSKEEKKIVVNHPFLYFVVDKKSKFIIVAGKVVEPKANDDFFETHRTTEI